MYKYIYKTNNMIDNIIMISDGEYLTGLYFLRDNKYDEYEEKDLNIFRYTKKWLDNYFKGIILEYPKYKLVGLSEFTLEVLDIIKDISYGYTLSYNDIAKIIEKKRNIKRMSAQAIGGAVGRNPISIIIPCHRVIGSNKKIVGYSGGIKNKIYLLEHEKIEFNKC